MLAALRSRRRSRLTVAGSVLGLVVLLAGCSNPGSVTQYNDDTRENFVEACQRANAAGDPDGTQRVCECWYEAITAEDGLSFDEFRDVESDIRLALEEDRLNSDEDLERLVPNYVRVLEDSGCVTTGPSPS